MEKRTDRKVAVPALPVTPKKRNYKDTVFRMLYQDKSELLSLYNVVNDTHYTDPEELEVARLENAVYMSVSKAVTMARK